jgi:hypothetical protein
VLEYSLTARSRSRRRRRAAGPSAGPRRCASPLSRLTASEGDSSHSTRVSRYPRVSGRCRTRFVVPRRFSTLAAGKRGQPADVVREAEVRVVAGCEGRGWEADGTVFACWREAANGAARTGRPHPHGRLDVRRVTTFRVSPVAARRGSDDQPHPRDASCPSWGSATETCDGNHNTGNRHSMSFVVRAPPCAMTAKPPMRM